jgi:enoyl-[acyl-carrier protein] reductase I
MIMELNGVLAGKKGIVFGLANDRSYAWYMSQAALAAGAELIFSYFPGEKNERRFRNGLRDMGHENAEAYPCNVTDDADLDRLFEQIEAKHGTIDFVVHSVAYADKDYLKVGRFHETPRDVWNVAMETSAYSLVAIAQRAKRIMPDGGSIIAMSYLGGEKVVPGYNVMGVAKSALEMSARYLALELGAQQIRVNCISGGPLKTLSAMGINNFEVILRHQEDYAPLQRNINGDEIGSTAVFLLSDMSSAITGEVLHLDSGFHVLANFAKKDCFEHQKYLKHTAPAEELTASS